MSHGSGHSPMESSTPAPADLSGDTGEQITSTDKQSKGNKPTARFCLALKDPSETNCTEIIYSDLLRKEKHSDPHSNSRTGQSLLGTDSQEDLVSMAKKFKDKYMMDIGYGYDDSDSFVDNSEAYDELVPDDWTTLLGGFYINQGELQYRPVVHHTEDSDFKGMKTPSKLKQSNKKSALTSKGGLTDKTPKELSTLKRKKLLLNMEKRQKELTGVRKEARTGTLVKKRKLKATLQEVTSTACCINPVVPALVKDIKEDTLLRPKEEKVDAGQAPNPSTSATCIGEGVADTLSQASKDVCKETTNVANGTVAGCDASSVQLLNVVAAETGPRADAQGDETVPQLPKHLPVELCEELALLKGEAKKCVNGKCRYFNAAINKVLLSVAKACQLLHCKVRSSIYEHLAHHLPCTKDTLLKRAKALLLRDLAEKLDSCVESFKLSIEAAMPEQKKGYEEDVAKALTERVREQMKQCEMPLASVAPTEKSCNGDTAAEVDLVNEPAPSEEKAKKHILRKRFHWTRTLREKLYKIVQCKVKSFKLSRPRSLNAEEYIKDFLEAEVRKLWPKGWMTSRILYKESKLAHSEVTLPVVKLVKKVKPKEPVSSASPPALTSIASAMSSSPSLLPTAVVDSCSASKVAVTVSAGAFADFPRKPASISCGTGSVNAAGGRDDVAVVGNDANAGVERPMPMSAAGPPVVSASTAAAPSSSNGQTMPPCRTKSCEVVPGSQVRDLSLADTRGERAAPRCTSSSTWTTVVPHASNLSVEKVAATAILCGEGPLHGSESGHGMHKPGSAQTPRCSGVSPNLEELPLSKLVDNEVIQSSPVKSTAAIAHVTPTKPAVPSPLLTKSDIGPQSSRQLLSQNVKYASSTRGRHLSTPVLHFPTSKEHGSSASALDFAQLHHDYSALKPQADKRLDAHAAAVVSSACPLLSASSSAKYNTGTESVYVGRIPTTATTVADSGPTAAANPLGLMRHYHSMLHGQPQQQQRRGALHQPQTAAAPQRHGPQFTAEGRQDQMQRFNVLQQQQQQQQQQQLQQEQQESLRRQLQIQRRNGFVMGQGSESFPSQFTNFRLPFS